MLRVIRMTARGTACALALSLGAAGAAFAQNEGTTERGGPEVPVTRVGTRGAAFLGIPIGARANALAGAGSVVTQGIEGLFYNPAAAAEIESLSAGLHYMEVYRGTGIEQFFVGAAFPLLGGTFGVTVNSLTSGDIPRTTETTPSGENVGVGPVFDWTSNAVALHYGRRITDRLIMGAAFKYITEGIQGARAEWPAADVGLRFVTGLYGTTIGGSILNIGGESRMRGNLITANVTAAQEVFETERQVAGELQTHAAALPTAFQFGVAVDLTGAPHALFSTDPRHRASVLLELRDAMDTDMQPTLAVEYGFNEFAFVRVGNRWFNENFANREFMDGFSYGLGLRVPAFGRQFELDYGYARLGVLNDRHVVSFQFNW
jgi:hypothetical protein